MHLQFLVGSREPVLRPASDPSPLARAEPAAILVGLPLASRLVGLGRGHGIQERHVRESRKTNYWTL